jgi:Protein of unknown function (DUF669)
MTAFDELPEDFDPSTHEGTDLKPVPVGWYLTQITEVGGEHAKTGNGTYLRTVFEILEGEHKGRKVFQNITLQNSNQQAVEIGARLLTDVYTAVGHNGPTKDIRVMLFKPVMARIGIKRDKDGVYDDSNCISKVKPPDYEPPRRGPDSGPSRTPPVMPQGPKSPPAPGQASPAAAATPARPSGSAPWRE